MLKSLLLICFLLFISLCVIGQDFSNKGKDFWVGYGYHQAMVGDSNRQNMVLYFTSDVAANVKVEIPGVGWSKTYQVSANAVTESDPLPKSGSDDARLLKDSLYNTGIHITSDNPIVAYAHTYNLANSGASLLFPVNTLGQEYYSLNFTQKANTYASNSWAFVIATEDNTLVEITPSGNTITHLARQTFSVTLQKGQIYNLMGTTVDIGNNYTGVDLTGTKIRSVGTGTEGCKRIAVYSGSGRVSINCENTTSSSDNIFQQVFPQSAWGRRFLTVPTANLPNNYFRIAVSDPSTIVSVDGIQLTNLNNSFYYEITANTPKIVVSDRPVMVAQYITSGNDPGTAPCGNSFETNGDPEMIYLSPLEQTIDKVTLNSTEHFKITSHYINVVIKTSAIKSFTLDGKDSSSVFKSFPGDPAYSYAVFHVSKGTHNLRADSGFNAIAYGYGQKESYGYNAGTNIKNLNEFITIQNPFAISTSACSNTPFSLSVTLPYQPTLLKWDFNQNPKLSPSDSIIQNNPGFDSTYIKDGQTLYVYRLKVSFTFNGIGDFPVKIVAINQSSQGCSGQQQIDYTINVIPSPVADFTYIHKGCATDSTGFFDATNANGSNVIKWKWDFGDGTVDSVKNPKKIFEAPGTYNVSMTTINDVGCYSDTTKPVVLGDPPAAKFGVSSLNCTGDTITFSDSSASNGANIVKWNWSFGDGTSLINTTGALVNKIYTTERSFAVSLQVENAEGCKSTPYIQNVTVHPKPFVDFVMTDVCVPAGITQFTNKSSITDESGASLNYLWNFGDGDSSNQINPAHSYKTGGLMTVTLRAISVFGCIKDSAKILSNIYPKPLAGFTNAADEVCITDSVHFADASIAPNSSVTSWFWNFGDGTTSNLQNPVKKFAKSNGYTVTLYIKSAAGCVSDTFSKTIIVNEIPVAGFIVSDSSCEKQRVAITDDSKANSGNINKWNWIFGDGTTADNFNGNPFLKTYDQAGTYTIQLTVETDKGCKSEVTSEVLNVGASPVSNFISPKICVNDDFAAFTDSSYISAGAIASYAWNFGDQNATAANPNTSADKNPKHKFSAAGYYNVSLTTTSGAGCSSTITKQFAVNGIPAANFSIADSSFLCSNQQVQIINNSTVSPGTVTKIEIMWDAGNAAAAVVTDNDPSAGKVYLHVYPAVAVLKTYIIEMRVYSGINCFEEKTLSATVNPSPDVTFSAVPAKCLNDVAFAVVQAGETTGISGSSVFSGNGISPQGIFTPQIAGAGNSVVKYIYTSDKGCKDSAEQTIAVIQNPTAQLPQKVYVLEGGSTVLQPVITGNVASFVWSPPTWLDNVNIQTPRSTPVSDITYNLTVSSAEGCTGSAGVNVIILTSPIIPNAFSPNGDGINDVWNISSLESFGNSNVQVFNRYGKIVFNSIGYKKPWDGRYNNSNLPVGVYYYMINAGNGKKPYTGPVTILR